MSFRFPVIRKVVGNSMLPSFIPGLIVIGTRSFRKIKSGDIVIVKHKNREIIKRISNINQTSIYVLGDNLSASTDSRSFGWINKSNIYAKVIWPNPSIKNNY